MNQLLGAPPEALIGMGPDGRITLTAQVEALFGYPDDELLGRPIETILTQPQPLLAAQSALGAGSPRMVELPCRRKDGSEFLAELSVSTVHSQIGTQVWMAVREAPEWQRAVVTRNLLAFIAESSSDAIISTTLDGTITYWNPTAERLYGYPAGEVVGRQVDLLYAADQRAEMARLMTQVAQGRQTRLDRVPRVHRDGTTVRVSVTLTPIADADGGIVGVASVARDTAPGEQAEARFRALLEAATVAIIGATAEGRILLVNAEAERLFGYSRDDLVGQPVEVLVPQAHQAVHADLRRGYMAEPRTRRMGEGLALTARGKDGTEFPVEVSLSAIDTEDGPLVAAAVRDLTQQTERESLEQQLQQSRRLKSLGQLAGGVAHDFNNLLGIIGGYVAFIVEDAEDGMAANPDGPYAAILDEAQHIQQAVGRGSHLTRQLLAFGRREVTRPQVLDVNTVIRDAAVLLTRTLGEHIAVQLHLADDLLPIKADPGQIEQIIINAAINARDAMPTGGTLTIDTANVTIDEAYAPAPGARVGAFIRLRIGDTGTGMTKEVAAHAFEPFFTTKPTGKGTGLGLSTVYGIATHQGGHVTIYSEPGHGTTLCITLPACEDGPTTDRVDQIAPVDVANPTGGERYTILVVDDEEGLRGVVHRILARDGHDVLVAPDGPRAIALAERHPGTIDLLITDVIMPRMLGKELAEQLTALRTDLRVLYMSGYAQPALAAQGTLDPGVVLLEKPFTESDLRAAVAKVVRGRTPPVR